jgi:cytochrome c biogenesis factor
VDPILILRVLKSTKTALYLMGFSVLIFLAGSVYIPKNLEIFSEINDGPLLYWLTDNMSHLSKTYWIFGQVILMALLSLNMIVCTLEGLIGKFSMKDLFGKHSPHIVHAGILLVLFGHLVSAGFGYKIDVPIKSGENVSIEGLTIHLEKVNFVQVRGEDQRRWQTALTISGNGMIINSVVEPAKPVFLNGLGIFVKSAEESGRAILGVVRDPGVKWEILGAVVFVIGSIGIFWVRYSRIQV